MRFHSRAWAPAGKPRAVIALVHGLGEHTGRYAPIGRLFADSGYGLLGFDLRGHGLSDGPRGHTPSYEALLDDISNFLGQVKDRYPSEPIFLYGHSFGGNLALNFALRRKPELQGVIATAPWLRVAFGPPAAKVALARVLNWMAPGVTQEWGLETGALSHDAEIVEAYDVDPLVHGRISARLFVTVVDAGEWALEHAASFPLPLLLMHGTADRVTSAGASREFAARAGKKVTWRSWDGMYHELHNEAARAQVLGMMIRWMDGRLGKKQSPKPKRPLDKRPRA
jgi:alpha-beta hydrolase superfamily lysophospholipase